MISVDKIIVVFRVVVDLHISGRESSVFHEEPDEAARFQKIYPAMARKFTGGTAAPLSFSA